MVSLNKCFYNAKIHEILNNNAKLWSLDLPVDKQLNLVLRSHNKIKDILKTLNEKGSLN